MADVRRSSFELRHLPGKHNQQSHGKKGVGVKQSAKPPVKTPAAKPEPDERGERLTKVGHAAFVEVEHLDGLDKVIDVMRRHKAANPDLTPDELLTAADAAAAKKYPPATYPKLVGFYSRLLGNHKDAIGRPAPSRPAPKPAMTPKKAPDPQDYPRITDKQAQQMQDALPPPWSGEQRIGLRYYTGNSAVPNGLLRGWIKPPGKSATEQKKIAAAQKQIEAAKAALRPSDRPMLVRRTAGPEQFGVATTKELAALIGNRFVERGFMSTTTRNNANVGGKVRIDIEVPEGTPLAFVRSISKYPNEDEVLLAPGLKYTILSVEGPLGRPLVRIRVEPE